MVGLLYILCDGSHLLKYIQPQFVCVCIFQGPGAGGTATGPGAGGTGGGKTEGRLASQITS